MSAFFARSCGHAQKKTPKAEGHEQCPLGHINTLGPKCIPPIYDEVQPTYGEACALVWMNIGAGHCKKKLSQEFSNVEKC